MKYLILALGTLMLVAAAPAKPANAVTVTINGEGMISQAPDTATVTVGITTFSDQGPKATTDNNSRYNDLRNRLHDIGLGDAAIRTLSYNVNQNRPFPQMGPMRPAPGPYNQNPGYTVAREVQITLTNLEDVGKVIDAALAANVTNVYGATYTHSRERALYAQALKLAVEDAQRQAQAMAEAAHLHVVRITSLQNGYYSRPMIMRAIAPNAMPAPSPGIPTELIPGNLDIRATVSATFILAP